MSNPLDLEMMSPAERLEEAASLLARGILRHLPSQQEVRGAQGTSGVFRALCRHSSP